MSKYDEIKSPNELVREVAMHGLSTLQEDICRAQDIFGRAPIEELIQLANNDGRRDDEGNPKLGGKWSSGGELQEDNQEISSELDKVRTELRKSETKITSQDGLILKLKARLYDVICEEEIEYA